MKVKDLVWDMVIEAERAKAKVEYKGKTYYFCAVHCQDKFLQNPEKYLAGEELGPKPMVIAPEGSLYTCPMDPEIRQSSPGLCPKCGMTLEPLEPATRQSQKKWICPMHPEIVKNKPGFCPICGMALEP